MKSEVFLEEVRSKCQKIVLPMVLEGNFNLVMGGLIKQQQHQFEGGQYV
jgi:hypothetical protein